MTALPDPEALLCALVLLPGTYSRNRFFELYKDPEALEVRRRASIVRSIVTEVAGEVPAQRGQVVRMGEGAPGLWEVEYVVPALGLRRTASLTPLELSLVRFALERRSVVSDVLGSDDRDRARIEGALQRLGPELGVGEAEEGAP
jgi:hypothetical protein